MKSEMIYPDISNSLGETDFVHQKGACISW